MSSAGPTHSAHSITPRSPAGTISPPGILTTAMPDFDITSAVSPVSRHLRPLRSSQFLIGRLNQPSAWLATVPSGSGITLRCRTTW